MYYFNTNSYLNSDNSVIAWLYDVICAYDYL